MCPFSSSFSSLKNVHCPWKILVLELSHLILKLQGQLKGSPPKVARASQSSSTTVANPQQTIAYGHIFHIATIVVQLRILRQGDFIHYTHEVCDVEYEAHTQVHTYTYSLPLMLINNS